MFSHVYTMKTLYLLNFCWWFQFFSSNVFQVLRLVQVWWVRRGSKSFWTQIDYNQKQVGASPKKMIKVK